MSIAKTDFWSFLRGRRNNSSLVANISAVDDSKLSPTQSAPYPYRKISELNDIYWTLS